VFAWVQRGPFRAASAGLKAPRYRSEKRFIYASPVIGTERERVGGVRSSRDAGAFSARGHMPRMTTAHAIITTPNRTARATLVAVEKCKRIPDFMSGDRVCNQRSRTNVSIAAHFR